MTGVGEELFDVAVEIDAIDLVVGGIDKKDFAAGIAGRSAGIMAILGDQLPGFIGQEDVAHARGARSGFDRLGPIFPKITHRFLIMLVKAGAMPAIDDPKCVVVAGKPQGFVHFLIEQEPVAGAVLHVVRAGGQIGADRFGFELADQRGKLVAAAKSDEAAAVGINAAEGVGTLPGGVEGRDAAAAHPGDTAIVAVGRQVSDRTCWPPCGKSSSTRKRTLLSLDAVVLETTIAATQGVLDRGRQIARRDEDADRDGHLLGGDQRFQQRLFLGVETVGPDVDAGRLRAVVLRRE